MSIPTWADTEPDRIAAIDDDREKFVMLGWRDAALTLSKEYEDRHRTEGNVPDGSRRSRFLAMPVLFLFRHFFELRLKGLLRALEKKGALPSESLLGHKLGPLWDRFSSYYVRVVKPKEIELGAAEVLFQQIDADDPGAQAFRYEVDAKGKVPLEGFDRINMSSTVRSCLLVTNVIDEMAVDLGLEPPVPEGFTGETDTNTDTR